MYIFCYNNIYTWALGSLQSKGHTVLGTRTPSPRAARRAIAAEHKRELDHIVETAKVTRKQMRLTAAAAELPAGRAARVNHRAAQLGELVGTVTTIIMAAVTIKEALGSLRQPTINQEAGDTAS